MSRLFDLADREQSTDHWFTPEWIFDGLDIVFACDVCAPTDGPLHVPCREWFDESQNGLAQPWHHTVWCNPPFSNPAPWCERWANHHAGIILLRADLSSGGPYRAFAAAHAMYVAPKRIQYVNGTGGASETSAASFSSVLLARGHQCTAGLFRLAATHGGVARRLGTTP